MKEVLLLKCGEIVLKGLNRKTFEDRLLKNLKRRMAHVADCEISMRQSVVYVEIPDDADADAVMECASRVFGFATISRAAVCPEKTLESIIATAKDYLAPNFAAAKTFKVESKRGDKKFPMTSIEVSQYVGGELAEAIGITQANLSILKTNKGKAIRFSTLDAICKKLNCTPGDILEYVEDNNGAE